MCGRYTLRRFDPAAYDAAPLFEEFSQLKIVPRFNIAPSQAVPVIRVDKDGRRVVSMVRWGLIPSWAKELPKVQPINARAETLATSPMFRQALARRRCLVPADGFYEWRKLDAKNKQPMFIHFPDDRAFAFAGIWERWQRPEVSEATDTVALITTEPNILMATIHNRMPAIIEPGDYGRWLDRDTSVEEAVKLLRAFGDGELEAYEVGKGVNSPRNDSKENVLRA